MDTIQDVLTRASELLWKFDSRWMEFLQWLNNFEFIVDFLYVTDDKKVEFLLNMVQPFVLIKIQNQVSPFDPFNLPYELLICILEQMFSHFHRESAFRFRFNNRDQIYGESVKHYALALEKLINQSNLKTNTRENLLKRFIKGLRNKQAYSEILKQGKDLTLDGAINIAQKFEDKEWMLLFKNIQLD
ncbi:hypothetical protein M0804_013272 [Polistes exclamans]|nr:hypothetical protein M0804_013272 [Polistes exclamans]